MYHDTTGAKVEEFLNIEKERLSKINGKIDTIDSKIQKIKDHINSLEDDCVKCDLEDNIDGKEKLEKSITSLRRELENFEGQRAAYERAKDNNQESKTKALKVQKDAIKEIVKVDGLFQDKVNEKKAFEDEMKELEVKIREVSVEIEYFRSLPTVIAGQVASIGNHIYGKGVLDERCKSEANGYYTKDKLVLIDLRNMTSN